MYHINNFKNFSETKINLSRPLTLVIGTNGSGKSNLTEAIELLSFIANGGALHEITDLAQDGRKEVRGGLQACIRYKQETFALGFSGEVPFDGEKVTFSYRICIGVSLNTPFIRFEYLMLKNKALFETVGSQGQTQVKYRTFKPGKPSNQAIPISSMQSALSQYQEFARDNRKFQACSKSVRAIRTYLHSSFIFDPNPKLMREYERIGNRILTKNAANLSAVLYGLSKGTKEEQEGLERLLNWIRRLPDEPYQNFEFIIVEQLNDVIFAFKTQNNDELISAKVLSDGTLRCLAVLTALETVTPSSRIIIEEFDNGLHPSRVKILVEAIADCCTRRRLNVLVTTHNPATLNALNDKQLAGVVLCHWDSDSQASKLLRLSDLPYQDELLSRGQLGDLVTRQIIEQYLSPQFEEQRKEKAQAWLADF